MFRDTVRDTIATRDTGGGTLKPEDGEPYDPAVYVSAVPNYEVGETVLLAPDERLRILAIDTDIGDELTEQRRGGRACAAVGNDLEPA